MEVHDAGAMKVKRRGLLFCQESPTAACAAGNGGVRSLRDNGASAFGLAAYA